MHSEVVCITNLGATSQTNVVMRRVGLEVSREKGPLPTKFNRRWETGHKTPCTSASYFPSISNMPNIPDIRLCRPKPVSHQVFDNVMICPECPQRYAICHHTLSRGQKFPPLAPLPSHVPCLVIVEPYTFEYQKSVIIITIYPRLLPRPICATLLNTQIPDPEPNVGCQRAGSSDDFRKVTS